MVPRRALVFILAAAFASLGASFQTPNFTVEAPTQQMAQQVAQYAEHYRKEKALQWIGQEMAQWGQPLPVQVTVTMGGAGGATSFVYDQGRILRQEMHIEGSYERLLNSVLPHEVTHTVFAYYYRQPMPRWADEGGAVLSEDDIERNRHDQLVRQIINTPGRKIPLRRLFNLKDYPGDVMVLYAEGYSVSNFLVSQSNRQTFLAFVYHGMRSDYGWDKAVQTYYRLASVEKLEEAWIDSLRNARRPPATLLTQNTTTAGDATPAGKIMVRLTAPPAQPFDEAPRPIYRGQAPSEGSESPRFLPQYQQNGPAKPESWNAPNAAPPTARLGTPQFDSAPRR